MGRTPKQYFRAGVGAVIVRDERILVFERRRHPGSWQLPQGGLESGEEPLDGVFREVTEETGIPRDRLTLLLQHPDVLAYTLPPEWRSSRVGLGQAQLWFYLHLDGDDGCIDISQTDEFTAFRWATMREVVDGVVAFRRPLYARLQAHLPAALGRIPGPPLGAVTLREISDEATMSAILRLKVAPDQQRLVAPNGVSIAQTMTEPRSWLRGIFAGETAVGLILLYDSPQEGLSKEPPEYLDDGTTPKPEYFLWRLMIGAKHQRRGYGRAAVAALIAYVRTRPGAAELLVSFVPGEGSPQGFYEALGFVETGEVDQGEVVMRLSL